MTYPTVTIPMAGANPFNDSSPYPSAPTMPNSGLAPEYSAPYPPNPFAGAQKVLPDSPGNTLPYPTMNTNNSNVVKTVVTTETVTTTSDAVKIEVPSNPTPTKNAVTEQPKASDVLMPEHNTG